MEPTLGVPKASGPVIFVCGLLVAALSIAVASISYNRLAAEVSQTPIADKTGREWQLVVIGSSSCAASNHPDVQKAIRRIIAAVRAEAALAGEHLSTIGVAIDWSHEAGRKFLKRIGPFDEVTSGHNWMNQAAVRYLWRDLPGPSKVPQVLLITRQLEVTNSRFLVGEDSVVKRLAGGEEIRAFDSWLVRTTKSTVLTATSLPPVPDSRTRE